MVPSLALRWSHAAGVTHAKVVPCGWRATKAVRRGHCTSAADRLLKQHGVKVPPVPVEEIALAFGFVIDRVSPRRGVDAILRRSGAKVVIELSAGQPRVRQRFSLAHELGHYCLGHAHDDGDVAEAEANHFAGALLVPGR
ncbi:MAG: ImmA/IrrE family metallo-endopeptidase [Actinomycetota bacterium]